MTYEPTYTIDYEAAHEEHVDFGCADRFGRKIGTRIRRTSAVFNTNQSHREAGVWCAVQIQSTRDGIRYGASQGWQFFKSAAEQEAAVTKAVNASRKRAPKIK